MSKIFIKGVNWALAGILSLLGLTNCCDRYGAPEYGSPHADYTLKGTVVNKATGQPITGIYVGYSPKSYGTLMYGVPPVPYEPKAYVTTNSQGEFKFTDTFPDGEAWVEGKPVLPVYVQDIDGEENGSFQSEYLQVDFSEAELIRKSKKWSVGEYTLTIQVALNESDAQ